MTELSPAQKVVAVFNERYDLCGTMQVSCLNQAERSDLAEHLREIADELSPTTETP